MVAFEIQEVASCQGCRPIRVVNALLWHKRWKTGDICNGSVCATKRLRLIGYGVVFLTAGKLPPGHIFYSCDFYFAVDVYSAGESHEDNRGASDMALKRVKFNIVLK